jgi:hypothetical protein
MGYRIRDLTKCGWVFFILIHSACALYSPSSSKTYTKDCIVPQDQSGTVSGKWNALPIPIAFAQGQFSQDEINAITAAATSWNDFYKYSKGYTSVLDFGESTTSPRTTSNSNPKNSSGFCALGIFQGSQFVGNVGIYKVSQWPTSYAQNAMALTTFCTSPQSPLPKMYMAVIEINYQYFFVQGTKVPDIQSIITHELGHLLGLGHSCEPTQKSGYPNCNDSSLNPDYIKANMFYTFGFDQSNMGEIKRDLGTNDQNRANCIYTN